MLMDKVDSFAQASPTEECNASGSELLQECSICLDRKPEVLLPCAHTFCCPCIEQWYVHVKFKSNPFPTLSLATLKQ